MADKSKALLCANEEINGMLALMMLYIKCKHKKKQFKKRRFWVHDIIKGRKQFGAYHHLVSELRLDEVQFKAYFRLTREQFRQVLYHIEGTIAKISLTRESISPKERLAICLRYLATGESYKSLAFSYRVGVSTLSTLIPEVCKAIWDIMSNLYIKMPQNEDDWRLIAENFKYKWQFPNCIGALDGKHVVMKAPRNSGSLYFNYKGTMSMVLMAMADANLKFIYVDIGGFGRNSDGGTFAESNLGKGLASNRLRIPPDTALPEVPEFGRLPYTIVADEAFPLTYHMMRPYPGKSSGRAERAFNYRLSRARRIIECTFGILAARWRIYHTKIAIAPERLKVVVKATLVLHNLLQVASTPAEVTAQMEEEYQGETDMLQNIQHTGNRGAKDAIAVRDKIKDYLNAYKLPWQDSYLDRGLNI